MVTYIIHVCNSIYVIALLRTQMVTYVTLVLYSVCIVRLGWSHLQANNTHLGLARTIYIYGVYTVFLAGKSPNIRSYTVHIYGSGQPYTHLLTTTVLTNCPKGRRRQQNQNQNQNEVRKEEQL